jgi:hypothetical protein
MGPPDQPPPDQPPQIVGGSEERVADRGIEDSGELNRQDALRDLVRGVLYDRFTASRTSPTMCRR